MYLSMYCTLSSSRGMLLIFNTRRDVLSLEKDTASFTPCYILGGITPSCSCLLTSGSNQIVEKSQLLGSLLVSKLYIYLCCGYNFRYDDTAMRPWHSHTFSTPVSKFSSRC
jgi:hypothetical protein